MKEIGGYFELECFNGKEYYSDAMAVNCGRNGIVFLAQLRNYQKIYLPDFICGSVGNAIEKCGISFERYCVNKELEPVFDKELSEHEAILIVNYYGQLRNKAVGYRKKWGNIILDNTQDFFFRPSEIDTVYTCRKYFGVTDGGYVLMADNIDYSQVYNALPIDESFDRLRYVAGRFERSASEFYHDSVDNNKSFADEPVKQMSKLTHNFMRVIDYENVKDIRTANFVALHNKLGTYNLLRELNIPDGAFMYPFRVNNGTGLRKYLQERKIFVPKLWPDVCDIGCAVELADSIVPIPCDQRYDVEDMNYIIGHIFDFLESEKEVSYE